jgi:hypothetical protein
MKSTIHFQTDRANKAAWVRAAKGRPLAEWITETLMDRIDQYNHDYQQNIERTDQLRATMWDDHNAVVSALTGIELTHEEARQLAALKTACKQGHPALVQFAAETLLSMFDDALLDWVAAHE